MRQLLFVLLLAPTLHINAQDAIPASNEPRHRNVFENEYLRVLDVQITPGDTTQFHKHETPSVFITLHQVRTSSQVLLESRGTGVPSLERGITFEGFYNKPRIHRVWNADTSTFHVMDIEILTKGDKDIGAPLTLEGVKQAFDAPTVRSYRVTLKSNQELKIERTAPILIVGLGNAGKVSVNKKSFSKEGDFLFVPPAQKIEISNNEQQDYSFAVLELK
jgi:hypothetical protein